MTEPHTRRSILDEARQWLVLLHSGRAGPEQRAAAEAWRCASPEHARAYDEAQRLWTLLGELGPSAAVVEASLRPVRRHRWRLAAPMAAAACLLLALWLSPTPWQGWYADVRTAPGEVRELRLDDGTRLTVNGNSALDWRLEAGERHVRLYRGQVDFQVAKDAARPFLVDAGAAHIRVTGTRFDVELGGSGRVVLAVTEGQVQASAQGQPARPVNARQQAQWLGGRLQPVQPLDDQALAWQRGRLVFRDQPLEQVFDELARYRSGRVLFLDDRARSLAVTGVFASDDPQAVLDAIAATLPVRLVRLPGMLLVASRAS